MATLVSFHAHPDDESILTGGTLAAVAAKGHRVVLVFATRGERGERAGGTADELAARRTAEAHAAAAILGVARVAFLDYVDSGTAGEPGNDDPRCFWRADVDRAAQQVADILTAERADVLTVYDAHGGYHHPDHVQVHRVGHRAATCRPHLTVYESSINRDHLRALVRSLPSAGAPSAYEIERVGLPEHALTTAVDVRAQLAHKRAAIAAHGSQGASRAWLLDLPEAAFAAAFGLEWFVRARPQAVGTTREAALLGVT